MLNRYTNTFCPSCGEQPTNVSQRSKIACPAAFERGKFIDFGTIYEPPICRCDRCGVEWTCKYLKIYSFEGSVEDFKIRLAMEPYD